MSDAESAVPSPERPALRASNADRERVAQVLQQAVGEGRLDLDELQQRLDVVYGAKTLAELEPVTQDLPGHAVGPAAPAWRSAGHPVAAAAPTPGSARISGGWTSTTSIAVMSGSTRTGDWVVPPRYTAVAIMGGVELDLTEARFGAAEVTIQCTAIMGGVEITVPDDITVYCNGIGLMGGFASNANSVPIPGAPVVRIVGVAIMGGVDVKRAEPRK